MTLFLSTSSFLLCALTMSPSSKLSRIIAAWQDMWVGISSLSTDLLHLVQFVYFYGSTFISSPASVRDELT